MRYRMIAIDMDGTLLGRDGTVSARNQQAIRDAQEAGVMVLPCTGRALKEAKPVLDQAPAMDLGVFVTGAAVCQVSTGEMLDLAVIEPHVAFEIVQQLRKLNEAVLIYRDATQAGHDYLVTGDVEVADNTRWWFEVTESIVEEKKEVTVDDMHHALRVGVVGPEQRVKPLTARMQEKLGGRMMLHAFTAIQSPNPAEAVMLLEIFGGGVTKWRGLQWIAQRHDIAPEEIAVIGDEINDLAMFENAGCAIAMANAIDPIKAVAHRQTKDCDDHGVAHAIEQMLAGAW